MSSLGKRKSVETEEGARKRFLESLEGFPPPLEFAKPNGDKSCVKDNELALNHHRGPGHSDVPIQFYHEIFQTFLTRLNETKDDEEFKRYQKLVRQLIPSISVLMEHEVD